jgi:hypothetical protein
MRLALLAASLLAAAVLLAGPPALAQQVQPRACDTATVVTGGTAVVAVTGPYNGYRISNPIGASESLFVDPVGVANTDGTGTTSGVAAGAPFSFSVPAAGDVSVSAATDGHQFACVRW